MEDDKLVYVDCVYYGFVTTQSALSTWTTTTPPAERYDPGHALKAPKTKLARTRRSVSSMDELTECRPEEEDQREPRRGLPVSG